MFWVYLLSWKKNCNELLDTIGKNTEAFLKNKVFPKNILNMLLESDFRIERI